MGCGMSRIDWEQRAGMPHLFPQPIVDGPQNCNTQAGKNVMNNGRESISSPTLNLATIATNKCNDDKDDDDDDDAEGRKISNRDNYVASPSFREYCVDKEFNHGDKNDDGESMPALADKHPSPRKKSFPSFNHHKGGLKRHSERRGRKGGMFQLARRRNKSRLE